MAILFELDVITSRYKAGFARGPVRGVPAGLSGYYVNGMPYAPDMDAVRECLPHRWRAAFDRAGQFWFDKHRNDAYATLTLRAKSGDSIGLLRARPYVL
jgi:hypothetical protein